MNYWTRIIRNNKSDYIQCFIRGFIVNMDTLCTIMILLAQLIMAIPGMCAYLASLMNGTDNAGTKSSDNGLYNEGGFSDNGTPNHTTNNVADTTCVVCHGEEKTVLLLPCRHLCLCPDCWKSLSTTRPRNCPLCRKTVKKAMEVYA